MSWYFSVLKKYMVFSGRASVKEYWMFILMNFIIAVIIGIIYAIIPSFKFIYILYSLFIFLPSFAVLFRRLHDVGKSGWFWLINLIPVIGFIWFLIVLCKQGDPGNNSYGAPA